MIKKILCIGMFAMVLIFVTSCGGGGTIIIENDHDYLSWSVVIGNTSTRPEDTTTIGPGESYTRSYIFDGTYYAFGNFTTGWRTKKVSLSGGETIILKTGDFW